jgi:uncharacterized protein (DUF58 family)
MADAIPSRVPLPGRRLLVLVAAASLLFLWSSTAAFLADGVLLLAAVVDWFRAAAPSAVREAPRRVSLKAEADVRLELRNLARRIVDVVVTDDLPSGLERVGGWRKAGPSAHRPMLGLAAAEMARERRSELARRDIETPEDAVRLSIPARSYGDVGYRVSATERGEHALGDIHVRVLGPWGLAWKQVRVPASGTIKVQPGVDELRRQRLSGLRSRLAREGLRRQRRWGEGSAFDSLREYREGDDPRSIDWKATARRDQVIARRYRTERSQNVMLLIDAGRLMTERIDDRERIDHALSAALLLTEAARAHNDRVGVMVFDEQVRSFLPPSTPRLSRIAERLAEVQPRFVEPNYPFAFAYLARHLRRRSLVVAFTDIIDARASAALLAQLARSTASHLPLIVALRNPGLEATASAPVSTDEDAYRRAAAEEMLRARAVALEGMRRAGVLVVDAEPGDAIPETLSRYLEVKRRGLL